MNLIGAYLFSLDLLTIITAYLFMVYGQSAAGVYALGQGYLIDLFSGGLYGLYLLLYLVVFGWICLGSQIFDLRAPKGSVIMIFLAVSLEKAVFIIVVAVSSQDVVSKSFLITSLASTIGTGLIAPIVFTLFDRLRAMIFGDASDDLTGYA